MQYSRLGLITVLVGVELAIAAFAVATVAGTHPNFAFGSEAPGYKASVLPDFDAGARPHVVVDDPDSRVVVSASTDGKVHITDATYAAGWFWGNKPTQLHADRTSDGLAITRASSGSHFLFGLYRARTEISLPPDSTVDIREASGATLTGLSGSVNVASVDGSITAQQLSGDSIILRSADGSMRLSDIHAKTLDVTTQDGSIRASGLDVAGGALLTNDGSIRAGFAAGVNLTVKANTRDGSLRIDGRRQYGEPESSATQYTIGNGSGAFEVSTLDGSIRITTNGA